MLVILNMDQRGLCTTRALLLLFQTQQETQAIIFFRNKILKFFVSTGFPH